MIPRLFSAMLACIATALLLSACSPRYNWREIRGEGAPYSIMLPAKPASHSRTINLGGNQVTMTMTAAEVDGVTFAVGTAELADAEKAASAVAAMKISLLKNIKGTVRRETAASTGANVSIELEATGEQQRVLFARFLNRDRRVYQVLVVGKETVVPREAVDIFLASFKPA